MMFLVLKYRLKFSVFISVLIAMTSFVMFGTVAYADNREPANDAEGDAKALCISEPPDRRGAIWFSNSADYYKDYVYVDSGATSVDIYIRGSVYSCEQDALANTGAVDVDPDGVNSARVTDLADDELQRGSVSGTFNWSTQGGEIKAKFDVTGLATNNIGKDDIETIVVGIYRCFYNYTTDKKGLCYTQNINVTVVRKQLDQSATINLSSSPDKVIATNEAVSFSATITSSDVINVGSDSFKWRADGDSPIPDVAESVAVEIDGANITTTANGITFANPGKYCRTVSITEKPVYATVSGDAVQCVEVYKPMVGITAQDYERGLETAGVREIKHQLTIQNCVAMTYTWYISGVRGNGIAYNNEEITSALTPDASDNCTAEIPRTVDVSYLNGIPVEPGIKYRTEFNGLSPAEKLLRVTEAPFVRFFGSDVLVCNNSSKFVYDNRDATGEDLRGSFSQYATFYTANNDPIANTFLGIRTLTKKPAPNSYAVDTRLASNWSGMPCGNLPSPDDFAVTDAASLKEIATTTYNEPGYISVDGNIYINGGIYNGETTFTNIYSHPVMVIRATGDIYIDPSVSFIEAVLIADGGSVYTCATSTVIKPNSLYDNDCATPLKIRGAVMATNGIYLQRAKGTRYLADTNPLTWNTVSDNNFTAAEIFEFPDYLNFVRSYNLKPRSIGSYDAYRSLPPRL